MIYYYKTLSLSLSRLHPPIAIAVLITPSDTVYTPVEGHFHHYIYR